MPLPVKAVSVLLASEVDVVAPVEAKLVSLLVDVASAVDCVLFS